MTHGFQRNGLKNSHCLPEREDHLLRVEGAAYRVRYRPGAGKLRNGHFFQYTSCLSLELRFLLAVMEAIKVMLILLKSSCILSLQRALSSHGMLVLIRVCLLSPHQTQQIYYTEHVRRLNITFPVLQITFYLFAIPSVMQVDPLQSKYGLEMVDGKSNF